MNRKENPLISIIIGMYKGENYIKECIESVIKQNYTNLEIILIDDGSPDRCGEIADTYAKMDSRIVVIHQENLGVSTSRNKGIDKAKGEYICIVDQDDIISTDYINYFYNLILKYDADIALTPSADKFFEKIEEDTNIDKCEVWTGEKASIEMLYHKIIIAPWNKMIKKSLLDDNNVRFNPNFFGGEGFAFSIEAYQFANRIAKGQRRVYHYRVGDTESGASKFRLSSVESSINAQKYIKEKLIKKTSEELKAWNFSNWHTNCDCLNMMVGCKATGDYPEMYEKLKESCRKDALCAVTAPVSFQQRLRGILFFINPYIASRIINHFRIRKFAKN